MTKAFVLLILSLCPSLVFSINTKYQEVYSNLVENYNSENIENIFNSFSLEMQNALPLEEAKLFFSSLHLEAGKIKNGTFLEYENHRFAVFKTEFDNGVFSINISLDENNLINGFYIKPFSEKKESNLVNHLLNWPTDFSNTIYSRSKDYPNHTQLSIAILNNGKVNYYGVLIENDSIKPIQNQANIFEIGSVTKIFTSTVYASLLVDKKLKTTDFINDFFPIPFKNSLKIRFQDLANHTSGLPSLPKNFDLSNLNNPYKNYKIEDLNEYLGGFIEINTSGKYSYSNFGYGLLGFSLALSQKKTFEELLKQRVFEKYKMSKTFTNLKEINTNLIRGLDENGRETSNWEFDVLLGGGGVLSTTEDLVKFSKAQFKKKNKELELTRKTTHVINENMQIGLGWHVLKTLNGDNWYWHKGGTKGYSSSIVLNVEKKNSVIVLSNVSSFNLNEDKIEKLCFDLMKLIESN